jgi:hypothetical protein
MLMSKASRVAPVLNSSRADDEGSKQSSSRSITIDETENKKHAFTREYENFVKTSLPPVSNSSKMMDRLKDLESSMQRQNEINNNSCRLFGHIHDETMSIINRFDMMMEAMQNQHNDSLMALKREYDHRYVFMTHILCN